MGRQNGIGLRPADQEISSGLGASKPPDWVVVEVTWDSGISLGERIWISYLSILLYGNFAISRR
jgi:hypothetical protein